MKKTSLKALSALLIVALFFGCKKDEKETPATLSNLFSALEKPAETGSFTSSGGYESPSKNTIITSPGFVDANGKSVSIGSLSIEFREINKKGDMIRYQTATQTADGVGLDSYGQIFVSVTESGKPVNIAGGQKMPIDMVALNGYAPDTDIFYGKTDSNTGLTTWNDDGTPNTADVSKYQLGDVSHLLLNSANLIWINAASPLDVSSGPTTSVCATLPTGFTTDNTAVFMVLTNSNSVFSLGTSLCSPDVLVGYEAFLVALAVQGNEGKEKYFLAHTAPFSITDQLKVDLTPTETSIAEIDTYLSGL